MILSKLGNKADKFDWIRLLAHYMRRAWSSKVKEALSASPVHADHEACRPAELQYPRDRFSIPIYNILQE